MKIFIAEPTGISVETYREALGDHEIHELDTRGMSDAELITAIGDAEILVLTNRPVSAGVIEALPGLKMISVAFAGIDHLDAKAIVQREIKVNNAAGYANTAVAELVFGYMLALSRRLLENAQQIHQGVGTNTGHELKGKTLGIVGYGAIGQEVARLAEAFGMEPLIYSRSGSASLETLFRSSDFISLHLPLNESTRHLIGAELFSVMKPSACLINAARGPIIKEADLIHALRNKQLSAAAIDVFDMEPPLPADYPLLQEANVLATPHIGFNTAEALKTKGELALRNVVQFIQECSSR
ncbi:NAD(P)-dependent oxidoreductase [Dongshaea marina]|uniref:NAD(P)-dependent oxidoreductase n=1 Tax=Dongshaea marina TaxID=2047966 RepID=UPI000D3EA625|nr:NAD(P)-dependent oxidoreductase [Dongshaea marina]